MSESPHLAEILKQLMLIVRRKGWHTTMEMTNKTQTLQMSWTGLERDGQQERKAMR